MVKLQDGHIVCRHQNYLQIRQIDVQVSEEPESREPEFSSLEEMPHVGSETGPSAMEVEAPLPNP